MSPYRWHGTTLELRLRVVPRSAKTEFAGTLEDCYRVRLVAPPVEGRANACLAEFLAKAFGVPRSAVEILAGEHSRTKRVLIRKPSRAPLPELGSTPPVPTGPLRARTAIG